MTAETSAAAPRLTSRAVGAPSLREAVAVALEVLTDLGVTAESVTDGRVESTLRTALAAHERHHARGRDAVAAGSCDPEDLAAAAVRAACAHLACRSLEDAYLALRTATDHLYDPRRRRP